MMEVKPMGQWSWDDMMGRWSWDDMMVDSSMVNMTANLTKDPGTVMWKVKLMETDLKKQTFSSSRIHFFFHNQHEVTEKNRKSDSALNFFSFDLSIFLFQTQITLLSNVFINFSDQ